MKHSYEDIINLPYKKSSKRPNMPRANRAAQFAPFAALTGYDAAVREQARLTDKKVELDEYIKIDLNSKLCLIQSSINDKPEISLVYFQEDSLKDGGSYIRTTGHVKKIDEYEELIVMEDSREIYINDIVEINCELFSSGEYI